MAIVGVYGEVWRGRQRMAPFTRLRGTGYRAGVEGLSHEAIGEGQVLEMSLAKNQPVVLGTSVNFGSQRLETGSPVLAAFWFRSYLIVLHAVDDEVGPNDNVIAYDEELQIAWRIESVTHQRWSPFTSVCEDDDVLLASNYDGCSYEVDSLDGSILARRAAA